MDNNSLLGNVGNLAQSAIKQTKKAVAAEASEAIKQAGEQIGIEANQKQDHEATTDFVKRIYGPEQPIDAGKLKEISSKETTQTQAEIASILSELGVHGARIQNPEETAAKVQNQNAQEIEPQAKAKMEYEHHQEAQMLGVSRGNAEEQIKQQKEAEEQKKKLEEEQEKKAMEQPVEANVKTSGGAKRKVNSGRMMIRRSQTKSEVKQAGNE